MGWFSRQLRARVSVGGATLLRIHRTTADEQVVSLALATWIGFANIGEAYSFFHEGWWLVGYPDGAIAINVECGAIDSFLRYGALSQAAERIPVKIVIDFASRPWELRGHAAADGVVDIDADQNRSLQGKGIMIPAASVREFPIII